MNIFLENVIPRIEKWEQGMVWYRIVYHNRGYCEIVSKYREEIIDWLLENNEEKNICEIQLQRNIDGVYDYTIVLYGKGDNE